MSIFKHSLELEKTPYEKILDQPVCTLSGYPKDILRFNDLLRGTQIFGGTGSGKSSGSGKWLAMSFLRKIIGGLVLCVKPDEKDEWIKMAKAAGRYDDLVIFNEESGLEFNFLEYEMTREGRGGGEPMNVTDLMMVAQELLQNFSAGSGGGSDSEGAFWIKGLKRLINRMVTLLKLAKKETSIENLRNLLVSALGYKEAEEFNQLVSELGKIHSAKDQIQPLEELKELNERMDNWRARNFCISCLSTAHNNLDSKKKAFEKEKPSFDLIYSYFTKEFPKLSFKTRSIFEEFFFGLAEPFLAGILKDYFSKGISPQLRPETTYLDNKIIILDFPIKEFLVAGIFAQGLYKYMWQQAMERRRPKDEENPKPVFLWCDEAQFFINPGYDSLFQTTARSSLVCTVYLTQSINNYYFTMGSQNSEARAKSLLSNLALKIFHANSDFDTNEFAANTMGKDYRSSHTISENGGSFSKEFQYQVLPKTFSMLRTGGPRNDFEVDGVVTLTGRIWSTDKNFLEVTFNQKTK